MAVKFVGLAGLSLAFKATPKQVLRATRNTIDRSVTFARKTAVDTIHADLKLKKKLLRDRLPTTRTRQNSLTGAISSNNKPLPIGAYKIKKTRISKTRIAVAVKDTLFGPVRRSSSAFINPKHSAKRALRRVKGADRLPLDLPAGPSVSVQFGILLDDATYQRQVNAFISAEAARQLRRQIK